MEKSDTSDTHYSHIVYNDFSIRLGSHQRRKHEEYPFQKDLDDLVDKNIIYVENNQYRVSQEIKQNLQEFMQFLKANRYQDFKQISTTTFIPSIVSHKKE